MAVRGDCLELLILDCKRKNSVIAFARLDGDVVITDLPLGAKLKQFETFRDRIRKALEPGQHPRPTEKELAAFGANLFSFCFSHGIERLYTKLPANQHVRIQLISNRSDIKSIPWEYIQEPDKSPGPLAKRPLVRIVPSVGNEMEPLKLGDKIKVLFAAAYPIDQNTVSWPGIKANIAGSLAPQGATVDLLTVAPANWDEFRKTVNKFKPHVVHFCGHGSIAAGKTQLLFMYPETHETQPVSVEELTVFLRDRDIRLVVLTACDTSTRPLKMESEFAVLAETLVRDGIPAVVANQLPVPDATAARFVGPLYDELMQSGDIDKAVSAGRIEYSAAFINASTAAKLEWGIPTLHRHITSAKIVER